MRPIMFHMTPPEQWLDVAHTQVVCKVRPTSEDPNQTCITTAGNTIAYFRDCVTCTGSIEVVKAVIYSVISLLNTKFLTADISNYYLDTPLDQPEYTCIQIDQLPQKFINEYNLEQYVHNNWIYFEITNDI